MKLLRLKRLQTTEHYFNIEIGYKTFWGTYKNRKAVIDKKFPLLMTYSDTGNYVNHKFFDIIVSFIESGKDELFI